MIFEWKIWIEILMIKGGYLGKFLEIDLSSKNVKKHYIQKDFARMFIGGRGFAAKLLWDLTTAETRPFSPENVLIVAAGPLTGTPVPGSGKTCFAAISPGTGIYGDSNIGAHFGASLKQAGFDMLVLKGQASEPTNIVITDEEILFKDARPYWGLGAIESENQIRKDLGDVTYQIATIGPAGENRVVFASIQSEHRLAGRTGMGAIMGYKKLKSIAIRGSRSIPIADPKNMFKTFQVASNYLTTHPIADGFQKLGTFGLTEGVNEKGILPVRNFQEGYTEKIEVYSESFYLEKYSRQKSQSCLYCPAACEGVLRKDLQNRVRPQYESVVMLGPNLGIFDVDNVIETNHYCNEYGLDTISAGNIIGFLMELADRKLLKSFNGEQITISWGDGDKVLELLKKIAHRQGSGAFLADGIRGVLAKYPAFERYSLHCKGLEQSGYDTRALPGMTLAYATADIGAHHNRAWVAYQELSRPHDAKELADLVIFHQHIRPLMDCLGACRFPWIEFGIDTKLYGDFYTHCTGIQASIDGLLFASERIYNITRAINVRKGISRKDDQPPTRNFTDPIPKGPHKGKLLKKEEFNKLLDTYYKARGWDANGIPTAATLHKFGLEDIARSLQLR